MLFRSGPGGDNGHHTLLSLERIFPSDACGFTDDTLFDPVDGDEGGCDIKMTNNIGETFPFYDYVNQV